MTTLTNYQINNNYKLSDPKMNSVVVYYIRLFLADMEAIDCPTSIEQAYRSYQYQATLYAKGRTAPGPKVTDCQAGHSWHNFGMAVDWCPVQLLGTPDWSPKHPLWAVGCQKALDRGFVCGAKWRVRPDLPHIEMTGKWPAIVPDQARQILLDDGAGNEGAGIVGVWKEAGLNLPLPVNA